MELLLGLDIGSTRIKAIIYTRNGDPVAETAERLPLSYDDPEHPAWCVWRHEDVWRITKNVIRESVSKIPHGDSVKALAVTGFGMDGLFIDKNGKELGDMISWHCPRTIEQYEELKEYYLREDVLRETLRVGTTLVDSVFRFKWMEKHEPSVMEKAVKFLTVEDYVNYKLCGAVATDYSMAATTALIRQEDFCWSDKIISDVGVDKSLLPPMLLGGTPLGDVLPSVAKETGLSESTKVVLGGHDFIVASFIMGIKPDELLDITGTWEMVIGVTGNVKNIPLADIYCVDPHVVKDMWCPFEATISGDMMEWMVGYLGGDWNAVMKAVEESPLGARGCSFLPHYSGGHAPRVEPTSLGAFIGMSNALGRGDTARAVLEGLNYKTYEMVNAIKRTLESDVRAIIAAGGAVKNPLWMQMKTDILGVPIEVPALYEATPLGAAALAGFGTGVYASVEEAVSSVARPVAIFEPDLIIHERYKDLYENIYLKLQDSLAEVNKEIHMRAMK